MADSLVDKSDLKVGDILLTADNGIVSRTIRTFTHSKYSHAAIFVGKGKIVEALGGVGVVTNPLKLRISESRLVSVYRHIEITEKKGASKKATLPSLINSKRLTM